ncbi:MAG: sugar ABC transporter permease [Spirochaetales bacterium]|nr:sugar ABC transporter permease [Spirochaetales bacterium]
MKTADNLLHKPLHIIKSNLSGWLFLLPAVIIFFTFSWYPIVRGFIISFQQIDLVNPPRFVGLKNFILLFKDRDMPAAWINTLYYSLLGILFGYVIPLILALFINEVRNGKGFFRLVFYTPTIVPPMAVMLLWKWIFDPRRGLANSFLGFFHLEPLLWLNSPDLSMLSLVIMSTWAYSGGTMLIYLAALQGVPVSLYEAAEIDGASLRTRLFKITLPEIKGVMVILLVLQIIGTMQVFMEPFVMTKGGPANSTLTVIMLVYRYGFEFRNFGVAGALGVLMFLVLLVFSLIYLRITRQNSK